MKKKKVGVPYMKKKNATLDKCGGYVQKNKI